MIFKEIDVVRVLEPVKAHVLGEGTPSIVTVAGGTTGTVVLVYGPPTNPVAYEIEFSADRVGLEDPYSIVLADVPAALVVAA